MWMTTYEVYYVEMSNMMRGLKKHMCCNILIVAH